MFCGTQNDFTLRQWEYVLCATKHGVVKSIGFIIYFNFRFSNLLNSILGEPKLISKQISSLNASI